MTDNEKIEWFDNTMEWCNQWDSVDDAYYALDNMNEVSADLFLDVIDQWKKVTNK